jgi:hypothetical protein
MDEHEETLRRTLPKLRPRLRAAFAGACAERGRMLYESVDDDSDFFFDALNFVWDYAMGQDIDVPALEKMIAQVQELYDQKMEDEESGPDTDALRSLLGAMRSVTDPSTEPAEDASFFAVDMAGNTASSKKATDAAQAEEEKWQLAVLDVVKKWRGDKIDVDAFESVGWTEDDGWPEPKWLERFYEG